MRKRFERTENAKTARPRGLLTDTEIDEIRRAYAEECRGEILIGMCGEERVITMLLPAQADNKVDDSVMERSMAKLQAMHCDLCLRIRGGNT